MTDKWLFQNPFNTLPALLSAFIQITGQSCRNFHDFKREIKLNSYCWMFFLFIFICCNIKDMLGFKDCVCVCPQFIFLLWNCYIKIQKEQSQRIFNKPHDKRVVCLPFTMSYARKESLFDKTIKKLLLEIKMLNSSMRKIKLVAWLR